MLRITLYKNCILNETYRNVISTALKNGQSVLERYLSTLNSYQINDLDEVYYKNNDTLNFDLELINETEIYEYNYMKMEYYDEDNNLLLKRYCFIKDIEVNNEIVKLSYNEDIFSSYSDKITDLTESFLSKSRKLNYSQKNIYIHTLPLDYMGNDVPLISHENKTHFALLLKVQFYEGSTLGESTKRDYTISLISSIEDIDLHVDSSGNGTADITYKNMYTLDEIMVIINKIYTVQSQKKFYLLNSDFISTLKDNYYYRVEDIAIIPYDLISYFNAQRTDILDVINNVINFDGMHFNAILGEKESLSLSFNVLFSFLDESSRYSLHELDTKYYQNEFKRISIGTFNTQIPIINNGTEMDIRLYLYLDDANYYLYLMINNSMYDITNDFIYKVPFSEINGEELSQNRIQKIMSVLGTSLDLAFSPINSIKDGIKTAGSTGNTALGIASGASSFLTSLIYDSAKLSMLYSKVYTSNKGNFAKSSAVLNAKYGIVQFKILSDNDNFVLKSINNLGYNVYEYCKELSMIDFNNVSQFITDNVNYDVIQFDKINIIGKFPRIIAQKLNEIFEKGFKIWYNENLQDDNLEVR